MKKVRYLIMVLVLLIPSLAMAIPQLVNYQGRLTDSAGNPITGSKSIVFSLYTVSTGGTNVWTETQTVSATNGIFNVLLGSVTTLSQSIFDNAELYLGIKVDTDTEMTPRQRIASVGYAYKAAAGDATFNVTQTAATGNAGNFIVNNALGVGNALYATTNSGGNAVYGYSTGSGSAAYFETNNASNLMPVIWGYSSAGSGAAVYASTSVSSSGNGFQSYISGTGRAGYFKIGQLSNSADAILAETAGTGLAGRFSGGDVFVQTQGKGLVLRATDGTNCYRVTVNNVGTLSMALVTCP